MMRGRRYAGTRVRGYAGARVRGYVGFAALALALAAACTSGPAPVDHSRHHEDTLAIRANKDQMFRMSDDSPLLPAMRPVFTGLVYYDIKPEFRVPASLTVERAPQMKIELQTSTNQRRRMTKVGLLGFTVAQTAFNLLVFVDDDARNVDRLFLPFGDLTNNNETYGGGRYLELNRTPTGLYDLDFNRAYNPYCVYNPTYDCPVPPRENRLQVAIPAGERMSSQFK